MLPTILSLPIDIKNFGALVFAPQPFSSCYHRECTTGYRCQNQIKVQEFRCLASKDTKTPLILLLYFICRHCLPYSTPSRIKNSGALQNAIDTSTLLCPCRKEFWCLVSHHRKERIWVPGEKAICMSATPAAAHHHNHESCKSQRIWRITGGTLLMPESLFSQSSNSTA
jgi:hypothetical protein